MLFFMASFGASSEKPHPAPDRTAKHDLAAHIPKHFTHASWYGPSGRATASRKQYVKDALFVAHRTYPFGTKLEVVNLRNHRRVVVTILDRGPRVPGRDLDLSYAAAKQLDMISAGVVQVSYSEVAFARLGGGILR
jgi:rare lipoprotein A